MSKPISVNRPLMDQRSAVLNQANTVGLGIELFNKKEVQTQIAIRNVIEKTQQLFSQTMENK